MLSLKLDLWSESGTTLFMNSDLRKTSVVGHSTLPPFSDLPIAVAFDVEVFESTGCAGAEVRESTGCAGNEIPDRPSKDRMQAMAYTVTPRTGGRTSLGWLTYKTIGASNQTHCKS